MNTDSFDEVHDDEHMKGAVQYQLMPPGSPKKEVATTTSAVPAESFATWRTETSKAALERQMQLGDMYDAYRQHVVTNHYTIGKMKQMLAAAIINDAVVLAPMLARKGGCFEHIAITCPLHADIQVRTAMAEYVQLNVDKLQLEVIKEIERSATPQQRRGVQLDPTDMCEAVRNKLVNDTFDNLNLLASLQLTHDNRNNNALKVFRNCRQTLCDQFYSNFDSSQYGTIDNNFELNDETRCTICNDHYTNASSDDDSSSSGSSPRTSSTAMEEDARHPTTATRNDRMHLHCCHKKMCIGCVGKRAYFSSNNGRKEAANCPFCRASWPLYEHLGCEE